MAIGMKKRTEGHFAMKWGKLFSSVGLFCFLAIIVAGCRSEEQGRITKYEPGVYKGTPDQALTSTQRRNLRYRVNMQAGATKPAGP
ncbi:MAG: hypothetical protein CMF69_03690 [Magnetovibrio sp.]|nr:hypothetical protein [Magnetovibrio sp.]|tara:strand:+ start:262 stop:519 length:258 start_codon:yes stop_codon:yes gene_type:complete